MANFDLIRVCQSAQLLTISYLVAFSLTTLEATTLYQQQQQQQQQPFGQIFSSFTTQATPTFTTVTADRKPKPTRHPHLQPGVMVEEDVVDRFNIRYPDGSYEFRYELVDGTARYERGYFLRFDKLKTLVVVGYYSYRMQDGRYITVFYNADQFGYRQNQSITPQTYPNLPRSIDVPQLKEEGQQQAISDIGSATVSANRGGIRY